MTPSIGRSQRPSPGPRPPSAGGQGSLAGLLTPPSPLLDLADRFERAHHELFLVGGSVRDAWLGRSAGTDLDLSTDATPEDVQAITRPVAARMWLQGIRFGTVGVEIAAQRIEITTFRTERYKEASRHPEVSFEADVVTDLSRRDFTINAMAVRLPDLTPVDPFGGRDDIAARVLRTPSDPEDSFTDDPLRMLRAFRFASELEFRIDDAVLEAIARLKNEIKTVSAERIRDELSRLLVGTAPGVALEQAEATGLTQLFLPELSSLKLEQDPVHRHKDVFSHTLAVIERTPRDLELRLAALLHDIGKPKTRRISGKGVSFHHHEIVGAQMAEERLRALRYPNEVVAHVRELIALHHRFHTYRLGWRDSAVRRYVRDAGPLLDKLNDLVRADCTTRNEARAKVLAARIDELQARINELAAREQLDRMRPELDGTQIMAFLGIPPGPLVGDARDFLMEIRLDEGEIGTDEAHRRLAAWARARGLTPVGKEPDGGSDA
ncbi:MAG TPA: CCA tRNA nucleotidyltransferase [Actinomycetota bacterium]|nr:CCA tRNA nucleotidyltransferase [Actinomycetota bacterium]